jgi:hypothetical protein
MDSKLERARVPFVTKNPSIFLGNMETMGAPQWAHTTRVNFRRSLVISAACGFAALRSFYIGRGCRAGGTDLRERNFANRSLRVHIAFLIVIWHRRQFPKEISTFFGLGIAFGF